MCTWGCACVCACFMHACLYLWFVCLRESSYSCPAVCALIHTYYTCLPSSGKMGVTDREIKSVSSGLLLEFSSLISWSTFNLNHIPTTQLHGATCTTRARHCGVSCQPLLYCDQWGFLPVAVDPSTWDHPLPDVGCWWEQGQHCANISDLCRQCRGLYMPSQLQWAVCQHFYCCSTKS